MKRLVNKLVENDENRPDEFYTPENLAWKLLMDNIDEELTGVLQANSQDFQKEDDPSSFLFEILITIFMEMIFDIAIIMNASENESNNSDEEFNPDMKNFDIDDFLPKLKEKFERVSILLNIEKHKRINTDENLRDIIDNRYCRVILRYYHEDKKLFRKYQVPSELHYHMILNGNYIKKPKLENIYAIIMLNDYVYQISFLPFKQIGSGKCGFGQ